MTDLRASGNAAVEPLDPDLALVSDYLLSGLPEQELQAVRDRLIDDPQFYDKAEPLLLIFTEGYDLRALYSQALVRRERAASVAPSVAVPAHSARPMVISLRQRARHLSAWLGQWEQWQLAGLRVMPTRRSLWQMAAAAVVFGWLAAVPNARNTATLMLPFPVTPRLAAPPRGEVWSGEAVAPASGVRTVPVGDSSFIELRDGAAARWRDDGNAVRIRMQGEVAIVVGRLDRRVNVTTSFGTEIMLGPGSYAIREDLQRETTLVTVASGVAVLLPVTPTDTKFVFAGRGGWLKRLEAAVTPIGDQYPRPRAIQSNAR